MIKGITAVALIVVMTMNQIPGINFVLTAYADSNKTITGLCTGAIENPIPGNGGWSYVYYGNYSGDAGSVVMKYRVLDKAATEFNASKTMLLDCDNVIIKNWGHDNSWPDYSWAASEINSRLNGDEFYKNANVFTESERAAIAKSTKAARASGDGSSDYSSVYAPLSGDNIFLLDVAEAIRESYGYKNNIDPDANRAKKYLDSSAYGGWWLRTLFPDDFIPDSVSAVYVSSSTDSNPNRMNETSASQGNGVSPAFNLNLQSVIFSSLISGTAGANGAEYKLTVKDEKMNIVKTSGSNVTRAGNVVTVPYTISGSNSENATQVSVLITDSPYCAGTAATSGYSYLKLNVDTWGTSGKGTFTLPDKYADKTCGTDYYAYILAEDVNDSTATDYASMPEQITIPGLQVSVTGVSIAKTSYYVLVGGKLTLTATVSPEDATDKTITWSSGNNAVATVDAATGEVTGCSVGEATITVTTDDGGFTATCEVTVKDDRIVPSSNSVAKPDLNPDPDTYKSEAPSKTVLAINIANPMEFLDLKVHSLDKTNTANQEFLANYNAKLLGGTAANVILTKGIFPRRDLSTAEKAQKRALSWNNLPIKTPGAIYAVCYDKDHGAYLLTGKVDARGTAVFAGFMPVEACNITLFTLK